MAELLQWWNLIFVLPFAGALFYVLMLCVGVFPGDHGADLDADADVGIGHGLDHVHDLEPGLLGRALSFLGIGRVPLSIIVISFCFLWGFLGFASNTLLKSILPSFFFVWASMAVALVFSIALTRGLANLLAKVMPATETYAVSLEQLTGKWGESVTKIDETFGQAQVADDSGTLHTVQCLVEGGKEPIPRGAQVLLLYFDKQRGLFLVVPEGPADLKE